jgi:hypothetical protein
MLPLVTVCVGKLLDSLTYHAIHPIWVTMAICCGLVGIIIAKPARCFSYGPKSFPRANFVRCVVTIHNGRHVAIMTLNERLGRAA